MVSAVPGSLADCESESFAREFFSEEPSDATAYFGAFSAGDAARTAVTLLVSTRATVKPTRRPHVFVFALVLAKRRLRCIEPSRIVWTPKRGRLSGSVSRTCAVRGLARNMWCRMNV